jgi:PAS domain S-box-containing protein
MSHPLQEGDRWFLDALVVPASLHDLTGRFLHMNAAAEQASGKSNAEMLGRHYSDLLSPEARDHVQALFSHAVASGEPTDFETAFVDAGGHLRGTRAQHLPLQEGDAIVAVLILAFDVGRPPAEPISRQLNPRLTPRQLEILTLVASGLTTEEIARELTLSTETVRNHLRHTFTELQAHTRVEAIATARRLGLLAPPSLRPQSP